MTDSSEPLKILIVEDSTICMKQLEGMLRESPLSHSQIYHSDSLCSALEVLSQENIDVILLDLGLPDSNGLDTLTKVDRLFGKIPIIVITADYDDNLGRQAVMIGAQDFLVKGIYNSYVLVKAIHYAVERNMIGRRLRETEGMYSTIFQHSAAAITFVDEKERLISWNRFTEDFLGMTKKDLYLKPIKSLYPQQEWKKLRGQNIRTKGGMHQFFETKMIHQDGRVIDVDLSLSVVKNDEDDTISSIGVFRDITQRKKAQKEVHRALDKANYMADEADRANRAKSEFLYNMSHEIRTPMNSMKSMIELVLDGGDLNDENYDYLCTAKNSAANLLKLINDILDTSKIEAGRLDIEIIDCDVREIIEGAWNIRLQAMDKGLDFDVVFKTAVPEQIKSDPTRLKQCLINLAGNAIKFTETGA